MTKHSDWRVIYRYKVPADVIKLKDAQEIFEGQPSNMKKIYFNDFKNYDTMCIADSSLVIKGHRFLYLRRKCQALNTALIINRELSGLGHKRISNVSTKKGKYGE